MIAILLIAAICVFLVVLSWPAFGAFLFLALGPLITGIARPDSALPLRPNEALMLLVVAAVCTRTLLVMLCRRYRPLQYDHLDWALLTLVLASSVLPPLWRLARGLELSKDDMLYALVMVKYFAVFRVFRITIREATEVSICVWLSMASATIVAVIGMLQVFDLFGVPEFLRIYYDNPFGDVATFQDITDHGTSTLAFSFGVGDLMTINLIIALALYHRLRERRWVLLAAAAVFLSGCLASGEISCYIGLVVAVAAFGLLSGSMRRLIPVALLGTLAAVPFWPVLEHRFSHVMGGQAFEPSSWQGRWWNLSHIFLPQLIDNNAWLLGVAPAGRVLAPNGYTWGRYIYIESGYVWLLWVGGVPLLLAFLYFTYQWLRELRQIAHQMHGSPTGTAATASFSFLVAMCVTMLFDPHLTMRGTADLFFPLLALSTVPFAAEDAAHRLARPRQSYLEFAAR